MLESERRLESATHKQGLKVSFMQGLNVRTRSEVSLGTKHFPLTAAITRPYGLQHKIDSFTMDPSKRA